ncbi:MAG: hypothetical protein OEM26_15970 [Saprospiraceae bacterium]|nr:hypothetical protein [Saprospiraceae bacterium]
MKKFVLAVTVITLLMMDLSAQEYKILTSVESIVPMGIGRSRIINYAQEMDASRFTTERTQGTDSNQKDVKRKNLKIDELEETKLLNFYSATGINFQNIASNDAVISSKLTELAQQGWELVFVTSGVESDGGETDGNGIFITRYIFKR